MTSQTRPLVSVVIPTYNHAHFLGRALQSVVDQTYSNWEAIVIDNHSHDNTDQVIQSFKNSRITTLKIHNNGIIAASRNAGINAAKGDWIAFLDSDDLWYPQKLEVVMKGVDEDPTIDVFSTDEFLVNELTGSKILLEYGPCSLDLYKALLISGNRFSPSATLVKRNFLNRMTIRFRENRGFVTAEDYDLWMLLAREGAKFKCIRSVQGEYSIHATNSSGQAAKHQKNIVNVIQDHVYKQQSFQANKDRLWSEINARLLLAKSKQLLIDKKFLVGLIALAEALFSSFSGTLSYVLYKIRNKWINDSDSS
jgi:glycosyltransferase involved in cell wall biosynthesis